MTNLRHPYFAIIELRIRNVNCLFIEVNKRPADG